MPHYLIINCGYTARLLKHVKYMNPKPLFIFDSLWGNGLTICKEYVDDYFEKS